MDLSFKELNKIKKEASRKDNLFYSINQPLVLLK